jgi:ribonuclease P protein component
MVERLLKRRDFLKVAKGFSQSSSGVVVQCAVRHDDLPPRIGFTCTKKLGNAVIRNRIRRRLKEAARIAAAPHFKHGHDYVLIGRAGSLSRGFEELKKDIISALNRIHATAAKESSRTL